MLPATSGGWDSGVDWPFGAFGGAFGRGFEGVDLQETDDAFVLAVDMPGFEREAVTVSWDDGRLVVSAQQEAPRRSRAYHRTFRFPKAVAEERIEASYRNGVLEVTLPVADETTSGTEIDIE